MLTDSFLDKQVGQLPVEILCDILGKVCIPLAGGRVKKLREGLAHADELDATMAEVELCIGLIFKPLRHHMKIVINEDPSVFLALWIPILNVTKEILEEDSVESNSMTKSHSSEKMAHDTRELTLEHLRNVIMVLSSFGALSTEYKDGSICAQTWSLIEQIRYCKKFVDEWKRAAEANPENPVGPEGK